MSAYYVWNKDGNRPVFRHPNVNEAKAEAKRLADTNKGETFTVLKECISITRLNDTFADIRVGEKFCHVGRTLIKTKRVNHVDLDGNERSYNAVRISPSAVAGWMSCIADTTNVSRVRGV